MIRTESPKKESNYILPQKIGSSQYRKKMKNVVFPYCRIGIDSLNIVMWKATWGRPQTEKGFPMATFSILRAAHNLPTDIAMMLRGINCDQKTQIETVKQLVFLNDYKVAYTITAPDIVSGDMESVFDSLNNMESCYMAVGDVIQWGEQGVRHLCLPDGWAEL